MSARRAHRSERRSLGGRSIAHRPRRTRRSSRAPLPPRWSRTSRVGDPSGHGRQRRRWRRTRRTGRRGLRVRVLRDRTRRSRSRRDHAGLAVSRSVRLLRGRSGAPSHVHLRRCIRRRRHRLSCGANPAPRRRPMGHRRRHAPSGSPSGSARWSGAPPVRPDLPSPRRAVWLRGPVGCDTSMRSGVLWDLPPAVVDAQRRTGQAAALLRRELPGGADRLCLSRWQLLAPISWRYELRASAPVRGMLV